MYKHIMYIPLIPLSATFIEKIRGACGQGFRIVYICTCTMMQCGIAQLVQSIGHILALRPDYIMYRICMI